jgi:acetyltransferase
MAEALKRILEPRSVAVVGASADPSKRGNQVVRALVESGFSGRVLPVHPDGGSLFGLPVATSVADLEERPDMALVCTKAEIVPGVLERCAARGIEGAVIIAAGFGESGPAGETLEGEIRQIVRRTGLRVVGPNTSGVLNAALGLNLVGVERVPAGRMALLSQSGNVALEIIQKAAAGPVGISMYVGVGNELDIGFQEYLEYLEGHEATDVVLVYAEGFRDGRAFMHTTSRVARRKPVVVLKGGRSENGASAVRSHTGAIAGSYEVFSALLEQVGAYEVKRSDELLRVGEMLSGQPPFRARGVVVLADGGGHAALAVDALEEHDVPLARLSKSTQRELRSVLGPAAAVSNPVDLAGAADSSPAVFAEVFGLLSQDSACGGVVVTGLLGGYSLRFTEELASEEAEAATEIGRIARQTSLPTAVHTIYADADTEAVERLRASGIPLVGSLELACSCTAAAHHRRDYLERSASSRSFAEAAAAHSGICAGSASGNGSEIGVAVTELEARRLLEAQGVSLAPHVFARDPDECQRAVESMGSPAALKVVSATIPHKTEAGGVVLGVEGADEAAEAFERIIAAAGDFGRGKGLDPCIEGVLISPMMPEPVAEIIVGARCDPHYGPVIVVGSGGIGVELLRDVAIRAQPIDHEIASGMLQALKVAALLDGFRGREPIDRAPIIEIILGVARCALENPEVAEVEVNPVMVYPTHSVAVDARAFLRDTGAVTK